MMDRCSRRRFLAASGAVAGTITAGCISFNSGPDAKFRLKSKQVESLARGPDIRPYLIDPLDIDSKYSIELSNGYKHEKVDELVESGTVSTRAWELSYRTDWGPIERDIRTCIEHDGTYYRIWVESREEVERERWVFYFDWNDQNPSNDSKVVTLRDNGLSDKDKNIIGTAQEVIPDPDLWSEDDRSLTSFTVIFHEELDPRASDLVPHPPFDYLEHDGEYYRAVTEHGPVELTEQRFSIEAVAESFNEYRQYAQETFPDARFSNVDLSPEATEVLETAIGIDEGFDYEEDPPLSEELKEVLNHLTITEHLEPHGTYDHPTWFRDTLAEYRNLWYEFTLIIYPEDHESH